MADEQITVQDGRLRGWFAVENDIFSNKREISAHAILLYCLLCRLADSQGKSAFNRSYLSKLSRISTGGVSNCIRELVALKLIEVNERRDGSKKLPTEYVVRSTVHGAASTGEEVGCSDRDRHSMTVTPCPSPHDGHQVTDKVKTYLKGDKQEEDNNKNEGKQKQQRAQAPGLRPVDDVEKTLFPESEDRNVPESVRKEQAAIARLEKLQADRRAIVKRVFDYFCERTERSPKMYSLTDARMKVGVARVQDCWKKTDGDLVKAEKLMMIAVDALAGSAFHMGKNDRNARYTDWTDHLFKSTEKLEKWLESDR